MVIFVAEYVPAIGWFFRFCFRLRQPSFHWIISDGVVNGIGRRSDSSDSDSVELMTPLTTPTTTPTPTPSLGKTSPHRIIFEPHTTFQTDWFLYNVVSITLVMWAKLLLNSILPSTNSRGLAQEERPLDKWFMMNSQQWLAHFPVTSSARLHDNTVFHTSQYLKRKLCFFTLAFFGFHLTVVCVCLLQSKKYFALAGHFLKSERHSVPPNEFFTCRLARRNKSVIFQPHSGP